MKYNQYITIFLITTIQIIFSTSCKGLQKSARVVLKKSSVILVDTGISNLYLIPSSIPGKWILIENGDKKDEKELIPRLNQFGVKPADILVNIITHGHADHGGNSAFLQKNYSIPIIAGVGDLEMHQSGKNPDVLNAKGIFAKILLWFLDSKFPPYKADIYIKEPLSLEQYGVKGKILPVGCHTHGSLVILLDTKEAFVGDLIRGSLGNKHSATEHFYMEDFNQAHKQLIDLVEAGYLIFYPGHWGPLDAEGLLKVAKKE